MWQITYQIAIHATPQQVWAVLTDLAKYPNWNRYSPTAQGELRVGGHVEIVAYVGDSRQRVDNLVREIIPDQCLCWESLSWYHALAYGVRCRTLTPQPDGTTIFREQEAMYGLLAPLIRRALGPQLLAGLQTECECLKAETEQRMATT